MSLRAHFRSLYLLPLYRRIVVAARRVYFVRVKKALRTLPSSDSFDATLPHNLKSLAQCNARIDLLIKPLSVLESLDERSKVLVVGPRNEHDLFTLVAHGFRKECVRGLDLISYSPLVDLGDMHATPYPDDTWDAIVAGWTLSYSSAPAAFAREMIRIAKPGAAIAIGVEYSTLSESDEIALSGYSIHERSKLPKRINSVSEILDLFAPHADRVFFAHDAPRKRSHQRDGLAADVSNVAVIFNIRKP
jgi:SAM-dependent methyltransferase